MTNFKAVAKNLNVTFENDALLQEAFTHRSYLNEAGKNKASNERLEFLGDAILSFVISNYLFTTYPEYPEGQLTNVRSTIVKTETLAQISMSLNFGDYLLLSHGEEKSGGRNNISLLADTFEAFLGAVFLDKGIKAVEEFLGKTLIPKIPEIIKKELYSDYKSKLQEVVQEKSDVPPTYEIVKTEGPDHAKTFWVKVVLDGKDGQIGMGRSKQEAEQSAAAKQLEKMI